MSTLETVITMQKNGMSDTEISKTLASQGIAPSKINEAINQAKIKNAISSPQGDTTMNNNPQGQPSITQGPGAPQQTQPQAPISTGQPQAQQPQVPQPQPSIMQEAPQQEYYPEEALYSEGDYYQQNAGAGYDDQGYYDDGYGGGYGGDTETIAEIAAQVVDERFTDYNKRTGDMSVFKTMIEDKVNNIEQRLSRIESTIDKLQQAIIQKIGEFGENTAMIKRDLENLHNTTAKLMNPLMDNVRELERIKGKRVGS